LKFHYFLTVVFSSDDLQFFDCVDRRLIKTLLNGKRSRAFTDDGDGVFVSDVVSAEIGKNNKSLLELFLWKTWQ
jgi:hypothetical protein